MREDTQRTQLVVCASDVRQARVSGRGNRDICRAKSACGPRGGAQESNSAAAGFHALRCRCSLAAVTVGSRIAYVDLRQPSQVAGLRRRGKGKGRERRGALPWEPGRQRQRSETGDGWALRMPGEERRQGCGSPAQERRRDGRDERRTRRRQGKTHPIVDWQWRRTTPGAGRDRRSVPLSR